MADDKKFKKPPKPPGQQKTDATPYGASRDMFPDPYGPPDTDWATPDDPDPDTALHVVENPDWSFGLAGVDESVVLCPTCRHCWSMKKFAAVKNVDLDGRRFMAREAYCTSTGFNLVSLGERFVTECNRYESGGQRRKKVDDE